MASPLSTLRKYQVAFFVFMGVGLMIVFVIGDPLDALIRGPAGRSTTTDQTVVKWRSGSLTDAQIGYERQVRNVIREFLTALQDETSKRKGVPQVQPLSLSPSEQEIVYTRILADKAEEMGLVVTDESVLQYLEKLSADLIPRGEIGNIFSTTIAKRISEQQALNVIKIELLAQNCIAMTYPDLSHGQLPAQAWEYYQRLHRRVKAEVLPLTVADFKSKVAKQPSQAEIQDLYDKAKDRYPEPTSPEPGFKRRRKAAFDFVRADRKKFEDEEFVKFRPQVTETEVTEFYDKNREKFPISDQPAEEAKPSATQPNDSAAPPSDEKAKEEKKPESKKSEAPETTDKPKEQANDPSRSAKTPAPASGDKAGDQPKAEVKPKADNSDQGEPCEDSPASQDQEQNKGSTEPPADPPGKKTPQKPDDSTAQPQASANENKEPSEKTGQVPSAVPATEKPAGEKPGSIDDAQPSSADATAPTTQTTPNAGTAPAKPEPKYKPLDDKLREEIRDRVARQKASRAAQERVDATFNEIRRTVEKYARQLKTAELSGTAKPQPPNLEKLAGEREMEFKSIPLCDPTEVQQYDLGKTFGFDFSSMSFERIGFHILAYRDGIPLMKPEEIRGDNFDVHFLYWKTKEQDPYVPALKDIHEEVVDAWKQREALNVAQTEAKNLAEKARQSNASLKETLAKIDEFNVTETNEFSWMTMGFVPAGMGMPALSSVDGVDNAGQEFMKAVFALKPNGVGIAVNQPHSVVYVVRIISESPSEDALRETFLQTGASMELRHVAMMDREELRRIWFNAIEQEMVVKWVRAPQS